MVEGIWNRQALWEKKIPYKCLYLSIPTVKCYKKFTTYSSISLLQDPMVKFLIKIFIENFNERSSKGNFLNVFSQKNGLGHLGVNRHFFLYICKLL